MREDLSVAQSCQKSYVDRRRRDLCFEVGDFCIPQGVTFERTPLI
jgi:hypothetical protein